MGVVSDSEKASGQQRPGTCLLDGWSRTIGKDHTTTIGGNDALTVTGDLEIKAKKIHLTAETEIVLTCGASTIKLTTAQIEVLSTLDKINT